MMIEACTPANQPDVLLRHSAPGPKYCRADGRRSLAVHCQNLNSSAVRRARRIELIAV
jgi:hypothetical protein